MRKNSNQEESKLSEFLKSQSAPNAYNTEPLKDLIRQGLQKDTQSQKLCEGLDFPSMTIESGSSWSPRFGSSEEPRSKHAGELAVAATNKKGVKSSL